MDGGPVMVAINTTTGDSCHGLSPTENLAVMACLMLAYLLTASALMAMATLVFRQIDLGHPVFGVVFQELLVLLTLEMSMAILLGIHFVTKVEKLLLGLAVAATFAMQFHQLSWLCITGLR